MVLGKSTSTRTITTLVVVIVGFYVGIDGEINFSMAGTVAGVLASIFVSLNSVYTSKVLPSVGNDKSLLLFYNNINSCMLFLPLIYHFERATIVAHADKFLSLVFWCAMTASGVMGFAIGLVTVLQVKATSPLTHNISGTAKAGVQSLLAFYLWGNQATVKGVCGIFLVLFGSGAYGWVQMTEAQAKSAVAPPAVAMVPVGQAKV
jgi:GDP-fucose transporter C1